MNARSARRIAIAVVLLSGCSGGGTSDPVPTTRTVTVTTNGSGSGTITSSPAGVSCGATCSASLSTSVAVSLSATPAANSQFVSWSGACTGTTASCTVPAGTTAVSAAARFDLSVYALTVALAGTGTGSVTSAPAGVTCGTDCTEGYNAGTVVTLTAAPAGTSSFTGWSGGGCTGTGTCVVTMNQLTNVTATFTLVTNTLTVALAGTGSGTVTSTPAGITCGTDCNEAYTAGTVVTLTAASAGSSTFAGWSGGGCTGTGTCVVTMNAAATVTATFTLVSFTMTVNRTGTGSGTVTSSPAGINCGSDCTEPYTSGTVVTLTAASGVGSNFTGWSGGGCTGTGTCVVTMTAATTITSTFTLQTNTMTVSLVGAGSVTSAPAGISCPADCTEPYAFGTVVTLTAAATDGSAFTGWSGSGCSGTGSCVVTMNSASSVTATFSVVAPGWPDSGTRFCTDLLASVTCPAGVVGQDGFYAINVPNYVVVGGRVQDPITGLVWERSPSIANFTQAAAITYCDDLVLDGATDWRVPSLLELLSIADFGSTGPAFTSSAFPGIPPNSYFWTTTDRAGNPAQAYGMNTNYAVTNYVTKSDPSGHIVRCVRGTPFSGVLTVAGGSVTDSRTNLVWQSGTAPTDLSWQDALTYCEALSLDGRTDWRLPSGKELTSIIDPTQTSPTISPLFASRPATRFWSSSVLANFPNNAYAIGFATGVSADIGTVFSELRSVRCVR
ncbi:MAG: DUF1566 domain-containing protein [Gemmatimonadaceae bacterium]|nr:DUF1566 domain-containing protein [Gemmatimonadaceae bacterium]